MTTNQLDLNFTAPIIRDTEVQADPENLVRPDVGQVFITDGGVTYVRVLPAKHMMNSTMIYENSMRHNTIFALNIDNFTFGIINIGKISEIL